MINPKKLAFIKPETMSANSRNLIVFNKKDINELSLNLISNIKDNNLMINNEKEIIFNSEISLFDLMSYYRVLLSKNLPPNIKLIEKVYTSEKEIYNFKDFNSDIVFNGEKSLLKILIPNWLKI